MSSVCQLNESYDLQTTTLRLVFHSVLYEVIFKYNISPSLVVFSFIKGVPQQCVHTFTVDNSVNFHLFSGLTDLK